MNAPPRGDPGLQPERTELAWRRTSLAIGVGSLLALRFLPVLAPDDAVRAVLLAPGLAGLMFASWVWVVARRRSRLWHLALHGTSRAVAPSGMVPAVMTGFVLAAGLAALSVVLFVG